MAQSQLGSAIEQAVREYACAKKAVQEYSGITEQVMVDGRQALVNAGQDEKAHGLIVELRSRHAMLHSAGIVVDDLITCVRGGQKKLFPAFYDINLDSTLRAANWFLGYLALKSTCSLDLTSEQPTFFNAGYFTPRPLTLEENMQAILADSQRNGSYLLESPLYCGFSSCSSIIFGPEKKFKVEKISHSLLEGTSAEPKHVLYRNIECDGENAMEFTRDESYNVDLTAIQLLEHPFWRFMVSDKTLRHYIAFVEAASVSPFRGLGVWLPDHVNIGERVTLDLKDHGVHCSRIMDGKVSFLRLTRRPDSTLQEAMNGVGGIDSN